MGFSPEMVSVIQHLFNSLSSASSTSKASERVPCHAKMFLNSLKADLKIILETLEFAQFRIK